MREFPRGAPPRAPLGLPPQTPAGAPAPDPGKPQTPFTSALDSQTVARATYSHLLSRGDSDLQMLLFETFGGWSVPVVRLFNKMRDKVRDKLSKKQYDDEVSWTTRTWSSLMAQRMSVALHMAAAWEIARELSLAGAEDEAALFGGGVADSVA